MVRDRGSDIRLMQGNRACAEAALAAGMRFFAGYPITPSSEIADFLSVALPGAGGSFIQMEDEIASLGAVLGASLTGVKAMTATSGPGFSLMQELIGYGVLCEIPCVIVNVQRGGPSTGLPTSPAQSDVMQCKWGSHGDYPMVVLAPSSVRETFELTVAAFNFSEMLRTPVVLLSDEVVGHLYEKITVPDKDEIELINRRKPSNGSNDPIRPYEPHPADLVPDIPDIGTGYQFHTTGLIHTADGFPTREPDEVSALVSRLHQKINLRKREICLFETRELEDAEIVLCSFGASTRSCFQVVADARKKGRKVGGISLKTLWPFPDFIFDELPSQVKTILVCEMNCGQVAGEVKRACEGRYRVKGLGKCAGTMITPAEIKDALYRL